MSIDDVPLPTDPAPVTPEEMRAVQADSEARETADQVAALLTSLPALHLTSHALQSHELTVLVRDLLAVMQLCESTVTTLVTDALTRGVIDQSTAAGATQWVSRLAAGEAAESVMGAPAVDERSGPLVPVAQSSEAEDHSDRPDLADRPTVPGIEPAQAARIAKVAQACGEQRNSLLADALASGRVGLSASRTALIEIDKVAPLLPTASRDDVFSYFLALEPGAGGRAIRELSRRVMATYADEDFLHDVDRRLDAAESLTWFDLPNQMTRLVVDLTPTHAAQLRHAVDSLSAPSPGNDCCDDVFHRHTGDKTGVQDDRKPEKRRADALMLLVTRSAELIDHDGAVPTSGSTRLTVTIGFDELAAKLSGFGTTPAGASLEAHHVRQLACDAEVLPMVLGSDSQPLDVGRERRLVTPAQRAAVIQRDRHCTFPGCGRSPTWCQVHHVVPWYDGGETSLANSALLCSRHHTVVHRDGYIADVTDTQVIWDLTPGRMPEHTHAA